MRVGFFDPYLQQAGGGERYLLTMLAEALELGHDVTLLSPQAPDVPALQRVTASLAWDAIRWQAAADEAIPLLSATLDLLVVLHNDIPPASRAGHSWLVLQFPFKRLPYGRPGDLLDPRNGPRYVKRRARMRGYQSVFCYSEFVRGHIQERLRVAEPLVLAPPVPLPEVARIDGPRERSILAVGRFFRGGHSKRHDLLIEAFRFFVQRLGPDAGWRLQLVGGATADRETQDYLAELRRDAEGLPVDFHPNAGADELADLYDRSTFLWHAAGHGADRLQHPERLEHFGIVVAEAMGRGCVPLAFAAGGVPEILRSQRDGLLWESVEELVAGTQALIRDPTLTARLQASGAERAEQFGENRFRARVRGLMIKAESSS